jgi:MarR family transcriptional regulator, organic hydroperoxide resistance regulator
VGELLTLWTRASKLTRVAADQAMGRYGVRVGQNLVLEVLWADDGLTPGELAERLHLATPTVVKSATRMEAAGLLERRSHERDARLVRLWLTERGRAVRGDVERARDELEQRVTAPLTADERLHLRSALAKIVAAFADLAPEGDPGDPAADADLAALAPEGDPGDPAAGTRPAGLASEAESPDPVTGTGPGATASPTAGGGEVA